MTKQWRIGLIVIIAVALVLFAWERWGRAREPQYAGRTVSQWFRLYYQSSSQVRWDEADHEEAKQGLKALGINAVPYLLKRSFDVKPDTRLRKIFYSALGLFPRSWDLPFYVDSQIIAGEAAQAICDMKPPADALLPEIKKRLNEKAGTYNHRQAIYLLGGLGEGAEKGVPHLIQELRDGDAWGQTLALQSLRYQREKSKEAVPALMELMNQQVPGSRGYLSFVMTLGSIGNSATGAVPLLEPIFRSTTNWDAKCVLAQAMCKIDPERTNELNLLLNAINGGSDRKHRSDAVQALVEIGTNSPAVLPALAQLVSDPQTDVSTRATYGLKTLGAAKELYMPQFEKGLRSTNDNTVANAASQVLWADPNNRAGLQAMMELIKKRSMFEGFAIQRLGEIGPAAKEAEPLLREVIATHDEHLREPARKALKRITAPTNSASGR
jgi:HEAT repeat protein